MTAGVTMDREEIDAIVERAALKSANHAIRITFRMLGVDVEDQESINRTRADLIYMRNLRRTSETLQRRIVWAVIAAVVTGVIANTSDAVRHWLRAKIGI